MALEYMKEENIERIIKHFLTIGVYIKVYTRLLLLLLSHINISMYICSCVGDNTHTLHVYYGLA